MVAFLKKHFVLVAVDARHAKRRDDWAGDFVRKTRCVTFTAAGKRCAVSASGKFLGNIHNMKSALKVLNAWESLPEEERSPKKIYIDVKDKRPIVTAHEPPKDALVLRTYTRQVEWKEDRTLRYTIPDDYPVPEPKGTRSGSPRRGAARFREAGHDFMWIPKAEWNDFVKPDAKVGDRYSVPLSFKLRILRYHLDPERGLGEAQWFTRSEPEDGKMEFVVEEDNDAIIKLRLEGMAKLSRKGHRGVPTSYEPTLLGYFTWNKANKEFDEIKMIALGEVSNTPRGVRSGRHPLGISFEYVKNPKPSEQVVPRGGRDNVDRYLKIKLK